MPETFVLRPPTADSDRKIQGKSWNAHTQNIPFHNPAVHASGQHYYNIIGTPLPGFFRFPRERFPREALYLSLSRIDQLITRCPQQHRQCSIRAYSQSASIALSGGVAEHTSH